MKIAAVVISVLLLLGLTCFIVYNVVQIVKTLKQRKKQKADEVQDNHIN